MEGSDIMLSKNGVKVRFLICLGLYFLSGSQMITGWMGTLCGVIGTIELATALLQYSPVNDMKILANIKMFAANTWKVKVAH